MKTNISLKALITMSIVLSACTQTPNTSPVSTNKTVTSSSNNPTPVQSQNPASIQSPVLQSPAPVQTITPVQPAINSPSFQYILSKNNPQWSPDGKKIVFTRGYKIYVADVAGTNNILLADLKKDTPNISLGSPLMPSWSPKGDKIAFMVRDAFSNNELYIIKADGSGTYRTKETHYSGKMEWFPNGEKIIFSGKNGLATINSDGSGIDYIKNQDGSFNQLNGLEQVEISPDSNKIFVRSFYETSYIYDFQTKNKKILSTINNQYLSWSPDSKSIIYQHFSNNPQSSKIIKLNIDDSSETTISSEGENATTPKWSPDGKKIVYSIFSYDANNSNKISIKIVNSDGSGKVNFDIPSDMQSYAGNLNWSPDGTKLSISTYRTGTFIINTLTGTVTKVYDSVSPLLIQWSPDSYKIFYADNSNEPILADTTGGNQLNLFIRPVNPLVSQFNIKSPSQSEIDELNNSKIVEANSKFGLKMLTQLSNQKANENIFISPLSMSLALAMTYNGAENRTRDQMMNTLEYQGLSQESINKYNNTLLRLLLSDQDIQLSIANAIFSRQGTNFKEDFLNLNKQNYFSEIRELDFNKQEALETINNWVSEKTNDKITSILNNIEPDELIFLINAIYFKGTWTNVFEKSQTKDMDFTLTDGTTKKHPMMNQSGSYRHYKDDSVEFIRLPYGNNQRTGMYIFLPKEGVNLEQFRKTLNYENMNKWFSHPSSERGVISIPKFRLEYQADLINPLKNLGMTDAFSSGSADFTKMTDIKPFFLTKALQKTFVEVNEEGTEAAAVTIIGGGTTSVPPPPFNFVVNRPFMTTIVDERTKTVLFMGLIYNPQ